MTLFKLVRSKSECREDLIHSSQTWLGQWKWNERNMSIFLLLVQRKNRWWMLLIWKKGAGPDREEEINKAQPIWYRTLKAPKHSISYYIGVGLGVVQRWSSVSPSWATRFCFARWFHSLALIWSDPIRLSGSIFSDHVSFWILRTEQPALHSELHGSWRCA